ncbi:hypothetical protein HK100_003436 [Physocladia obscura]|uniref:Uncharacterized protein n=1 Tax=Physocladia obscura TaxID=109957 RepID=A0AAD5T7R0_9FUNG|nr:hypothetical protein HK100_003436 [Physocladia obscura]
MSSSAKHAKAKLQVGAGINSFTKKLPKGIFQLFVDLDFDINKFPEWDAGSDETLKIKDIMTQIMTQIICLNKEIVQQLFGIDNIRQIVTARMFYKFDIHYPDIIVNSARAVNLAEQFCNILQKDEVVSSYYQDKCVDHSVYTTGLQII